MPLAGTAKDNVKYKNSHYAMNIMAVDSTFFHFFRYPVLTGEARLTAPDDAVITRQYARRLFGKENPVGKVVEYYGKDVIIRGVIDEPGCKTLLRFDMLVSYNLVKQWQRMDISLKRVLPGVDLDEINQVSNVFKKDKMATAYVGNSFLGKTSIGKTLSGMMTITTPSCNSGITHICIFFRA